MPGSPWICQSSPRPARRRRIATSGSLVLMLASAPMCQLARADSGTAAMESRSLVTLPQLPATTAAALIHGAPQGSNRVAASDFDPDRFADGMPAALSSRVVRETPAFGGSLLMEMPRSNADGTIQQPRFAFGFQSPGMRSMLQAIGIDAAQCLAPVLRGRAHLGASPSATIGFSVRCTLR